MQPRRWVLAGVGALVALATAACGDDTAAEARKPAPERPAAVVPAEVTQPTSAVADDPAPAPAPAPPAPAEPTVEHLELVVDGHRRTAVAVHPGNPAPARPLIVLLHGRGGTGEAMLGVGLHEQAVAAGVSVVLPDGLGASWNDDRPGLLAPVAADDVVFLDALVAELARTTGIDPHRVAIGGFSNGALMTNRYACERADRIVAAVLVGAAGAAGTIERCHPVRAVPMLIVQGDADEIVPYAGGAVAGVGRGVVDPTAEVVAHWAQVNGCRAWPLRTNVPTADVLRGAECAAGATVEHYRILGGTHQWVRGPSLDTTAVAWDFLDDELLAESDTAESDTRDTAG